VRVSLGWVFPGETPVKVVLLAGGFGTRLSEETSRMPKPMVEIGGRPILVHIMELYSYHGFKDFVVACGYLGHVIKDYFARFSLQNFDFSVDLGTGETTVLERNAVDWRVALIDTGLDTMTGGRLSRVGPHLGETTFLATYGDGLADIDIQDLVDFHKRHGKLATITAVRPEARFGSLSIEDRRVVGFEEKVVSSQAWINGGFFVLEPEVLSYIENDVPFERAPLEGLARDGELMAFEHDGFWKPMDTLRDKRELERLWESGHAPWVPSTQP
jgi:glucose-1-phosphate cytidylyltransferase